MQDTSTMADYHLLSGVQPRKAATYLWNAFLTLGAAAGVAFVALTLYMYLGTYSSGIASTNDLAVQTQRINALYANGSVVVVDDPSTTASLASLGVSMASVTTAEHLLNSSVVANTANIVLLNGSLSSLSSKLTLVNTTVQSNSVAIASNSGQISTLQTQLTQVNTTAQANAANIASVNTTAQTNAVNFAAVNATAQTNAANIASVNASVQALAQQAFVPGSETTVGYKYLTMNNFVWNTAITYTGAGTLKKLWMAFSLPKDKIFMSITVDGAATAQIGCPATGTPASPACMNIDQMMTKSFAVAANSTYVAPWTTITYDDGTATAGFIAFDMPFSTGFTVNFYLSSGTGGLYSINSYINTAVPATPLRLRTKRINIASAAYPNEYPLLSVSSPNGVTLKAVKMIFSGCTNNWVEGRVKIYSGGPGMSSTINQNHYMDGTNQVPNGCYLSTCTAGQNATLMWQSTGTDSFFLFSWGFNVDTADFSQAIPPGAPAIVSPYGGLLYASQPQAGNPWPLNSAAVRVYNTGASDDNSAPSVPANTYFTLSHSMGDIRGSPSFGSATGNCNSITGDVWYYA